MEGDAPGALDLLARLGPVLADAAADAFAVLLRVGATLSLLPVFGEAAVPARIKLALALAFTAVVAPAVAGTLPHPATSAGLVLLALGEAAAGLVLGLALRLLVMALQTAGTMAAQATSLSQLFGAGPGAEPSPAMGHVLTLAGLALAAALGLHVRAAQYMIEGYALLPAGGALDPGLLLEAGLAEVGRSFALALSLAAPFVALALLYNLALGAVSRAMPQLMVTFIGAPALTLGGLALLLVAAPMILAAWADALGTALAAPFGPRP